MADTFLDWAGDSQRGALAEMLAAIFGTGRRFRLEDYGTNRVRAIGTGIDGAAVDIPIRLISIADVRVDYIS